MPTSADRMVAELEELTGPGQVAPGGSPEAKDDYTHDEALGLTPSQMLALAEAQLRAASDP